MKNESMVAQYKENLAYHITELDEASKDKNPAKFRLAFNSFKVFVVAYWTQIDYDLDSRTRKQIEEVFNIENSTEFRIYKFVSENMDYFFRFAYFVCFNLYVLLKIAFIYELIWLEAVSIIVFIIANFLYVFLHIYFKRIENEWSWKNTINYYAYFRFIFPRQQKLKMNENNDKKKGSDKK